MRVDPESEFGDLLVKFPDSYGQPTYTSSIAASTKRTSISKTKAGKNAGRPSSAVMHGASVERPMSAAGSRKQSAGIRQKRPSSAIGYSKGVDSNMLVRTSTLANSLAKQHVQSRLNVLSRPSSASIDPTIYSKRNTHENRVRPHSGSGGGAITANGREGMLAEYHPRSNSRNRPLSAPASSPPKFAVTVEEVIQSRTGLLPEDAINVPGQLSDFGEESVGATRAHKLPEATDQNFHFPATSTSRIPNSHNELERKEGNLRSQAYLGRANKLRGEVLRVQMADRETNFSDQTDISDRKNLESSQYGQAGPFEHAQLNDKQADVPMQMLELEEQIENSEIDTSTLNSTDAIAKEERSRLYALADLTTSVHEDDISVPAAQPSQSGTIFAGAQVATAATSVNGSALPMTVGGLKQQTIKVDGVSKTEMGLTRIEPKTRVLVPSVSALVSGQTDVKIPEQRQGRLKIVAEIESKLLKGLQSCAAEASSSTDMDPAEDSCSPSAAGASFMSRVHRRLAEDDEQDQLSESNAGESNTVDSSRAAIALASLKDLLLAFPSLSPVLQRCVGELDMELTSLRLQVKQQISKAERATAEARKQRMLAQNSADAIHAEVDVRTQKVMSVLKDKEMEVDAIAQELKDREARVLSQRATIEKMKSRCQEMESRLESFKSGFVFQRNRDGAIASGLQMQLEDMEKRMKDEMVPLGTFNELRAELGTKEQLLEQCKTEQDVYASRLSRSQAALQSLKSQLAVQKMLTAEARLKQRWSAVANQVFNRTDLTDAHSLKTFLTNLKIKIETLENRIYDLEHPAEEEEIVIGTVAEAKAGPEDYGPESFPGLGDVEKIPKFLRAKHEVKNLKMKKFAAERFIKQLMDGRRKERVKNNEPIGDFFHRYLHLQHGNEKHVLEIGYSLLNACERYIEDNDCELFLSIVRGEISEDVYFNQIDLCERVVKSMHDADKRRSAGKPSGKLPSEKAKKVLKKTFKLKLQSRLEELYANLDSQCGVKNIVYDSLFEEDREGNQGDFAECVRDQYLEERKEYLADIEDGLRQVCDDRWRQGQGASSNAEITVAGAYGAIKTVDPGKPYKAVQSILEIGFGVPKGKQLDQDEGIKATVTAFVKRIRAFPLERSSWAEHLAARHGGGSVTIADSEGS